MIMSTSTGIVGKDKGDDWDGYEDGFEDNAWRPEWRLVPRAMLSHFGTPREEVVGMYSNKGKGKGKGEDEEREGEGERKRTGNTGTLEYTEPDGSLPSSGDDVDDICTLHPVFDLNSN
ncbi:hypothetical protein D9758_012646 [Tetrapyrgos nigripes]|uniref:Uncharacterized protein n=1 Tax=Tetrapyrgos nigripes TaxID=182062 RepID=A0A8H5LMW9_9AGAR|nr:hypothetical protein D9758_012646 [Tetrapyrgos nigripes]